MNSEIILNNKKLNTVRWGIIGVGDVTEVKSGPAFYKVAHSSAVAVMRRDLVKAADYAKRHGITKWYSDATELINDPEVDAVYVATPPNSHAKYAIQTMRAGKPVYVEKPMAKNYQECIEMNRVSRETGMPLMVAYYRRTLPAFLKVKEMIDFRVIGKPLIVNIKLFKQAIERHQKPEEMHWHVFPEIGGGGHFFDLASHQMDYLDFIFGPVSNVKGNAMNIGGFYSAEDSVTGTWIHKSGVLGSGSWCFVVDKNSVKDEIEIIGESGKITLPCFSHGNVIVKTEHRFTELEFRNPEHISQNLVQQVVETLRGNTECVSTGDSAARTSWVLDEMVKNYYLVN